MINKLLYSFIALILSTSGVYCQQKKWSSSDIKIGLEKLNILGSVLYFAAHPDDENTRLIAWLAQEKKYRTGYLSLTRGEGGQNLIGTNLGIDLGLIRTNELLAARGIDKGEQFFSSAFDFGFSKTHEETFQFWDKESVLADAVYIIRKFRPDIIINRFPPDRRGGHGHHQASAILAREAFDAAADPKRFPEQLKEVKPWQAKRLVWNTANFGGMNNTSEDQLKINIGAYSALLGESYGEIASHSRSQHKSQGFGAAATRGNSIEYFEHVAGSEAKSELMEGIITDWSRIPNTQNIQRQIQHINTSFDPTHPERIVADLFQLKKDIQAISDSYWREQKTKETEDLILACAGIWIDATTQRANYPAGEEIAIQIEAIVRNPGFKTALLEINNKSMKVELKENILWKGNTADTWLTNTQPYWLSNPKSRGKYNFNSSFTGNPTNPARPSVEIVITINEETIRIKRDVQYRFVDPVRGEVYQATAVLPQITASIDQPNLLLTTGKSKEIIISFQNNNPKVKKQRVNILPPDGWEVTPGGFDLDFQPADMVKKNIVVRAIAPSNNSGTIYFKSGVDTLKSIQHIDYNHIPAITWFPTASINCQSLNISNPIQKVGYLAGAGDLIPQSLENIGIAVSLLNSNQMLTDNLKQFDAIVVGVRFFNVQENGQEVMDKLLAYVESGGVVLVQYNVNSKISTNKLGPFPFSLSRDRVTEEDAKIKFDGNDRVFQYPNKITEADFDNWVQERGLYFAQDIHKAYRTPLLMNDKGESPHKGSLLIASYGKGKFVYTSLSFFRQLPAGVPGAYRLFVNLLAKEK